MGQILMNLLSLFYQENCDEVIIDKISKCPMDIVKLINKFNTHACRQCNIKMIELRQKKNTMIKICSYCFSINCNKCVYTCPFCYNHFCFECWQAFNELNNPFLSYICFNCNL